ncbi:MAG: hypothetical protein IKP01_02225 [Bacteroidales bacterium]|nr:hypothetical protein [Bacteroidales bacterium]
MDWTQGYASRWRVERVDPNTWESCGTLEGVEKIEVERDATDRAPLLETASMTVTAPALASFEPGWHRIVMEAVQGSTGESVAIATVWLDVDNSTYDRGYRSDDIEGRSTLCQAADSEVGDGSYAPKGADGAAFAGDMIAAVSDAPVHVEGGFQLHDHVVFDLGASVLEAAWDVVEAGGYCMQIDGRGEIHVIPMPTVPALDLDRAGACTLMPKVKSRGGEVEYEREWAPNVHPFSIVRGAIPERGLDGFYRIATQKLVCDKGVSVEETAEEV